MSKKKVYAELRGYEGPIFPAVVEKLFPRRFPAKKYVVDGRALGKIGKRIHCFIGMYDAITKDGYEWFWALHFRTKEGKVVVLFPWSQKPCKNDNTYSHMDRSIAVYQRGKVTASEIRAIMAGLLEGFRMLKRGILPKN